MSVEDLLKPRYKVIAEYPTSSSYFKIGDILEWIETQQCFYGGIDARISKDTIGRYPHLFKKLEWHEERKEDEMPEYVKQKNIIWKVYSWNMEMLQPNPEEGEPPISWFWKREGFLPATKSEYAELEKAQ